MTREEKREIVEGITKVFAGIYGDYSRSDEFNHVTGEGYIRQSVSGSENIVLFFSLQEEKRS